MAELDEIASRIVGWAAEGEDVEAYVAWERETEVRAFDGDVESLSSAESAGAGIRVVTGSRQGFAYAGSLDESVLADTLAEARDNASFSTPDEHVGLARPDGVAPPELDLWRPEMASVPNQDRIEIVLDLERQLRASDPRIRQVERSVYGDVLAERAVATTTGIAVRTRASACHLSASAIAGEANDTHTGVGFSAGRALSDLDPAEACADAASRATRMLGARKPSSGRVAVVLDNRVTTVLLSILSGTLSGEAVAKGRSLFADRVGEEVAASSLTLSDDPTNESAYGASTHDSEGLACRRNVPIEDGVLRGFLYDTYAANRAGVSSTASAVRAGFKGTPGVGCRAVSLSPGGLDQQEMIAAVGEGLFVQSVTGVHSGVNPISGDFSVGAEGLMIRAGALAEPVREATIASTIQKMLLNVIHVGSDLQWLPGMAAGVTLAIGEVSLSGT